LVGKSCTDSLMTRFVPIVLKKHADPGSPYEVDAISGGTMTSNGVTAMLET
jgi:Na+-transporting NADH:ubiquinone oxidoreductase subunit NqrC